MQERIGSIRALTALPVCVGLGVESRDDVRALHEVADGVIVGTRNVDFADGNRDAPDFPARVASLAEELMS